jgi:N-acetyl-anhydromuramyl-L-alanine amidase AmpD
MKTKTIILCLLTALCVNSYAQIAYTKSYGDNQQSLTHNGYNYLQADFSEHLKVYSKSTNQKVLDEEQKQWLHYLNQPQLSLESLFAYIDKIAEKYQVPSEILKSVAYTENNFAHIGPSIDKGWGIMHLVENEYSQTLSEAAALLNTSKEEVRDNVMLNIEGFAALLDKKASEYAIDRSKIEAWFTPLMHLTGLDGENLQKMQALNYMKALKEGYTTTTLWGQQFTSKPQPCSISDKWHPEFNSDNKAVDYPGAVNQLTSCNYSYRGGVNVDTYVNHYIGTGTVAGALSWFKNCNAQVSAHFTISESGTIYQSVRTAYKAWHAGAYGTTNNARSIGVEHDATVTDPGRWNTPSMLIASTNLANHICDMYGINKQRTYGPYGITGHNDMPNTNTSCPGPLPWNTWFEYLGGQTEDYTPTPTFPSNYQHGVPSPVSFQWSSDIDGSSFRIQVSENKGGWTPEDGFQAEAGTNETVVVNAGTSNKYYNWSTGAPNSHKEPEPGRKYWWTVRGWEANAGLTSYFEPQSFTTQHAEGVTLIEHFESSNGRFTSDPTYSGSTQGISSNSAITHAGYMAENGEGSMRIELKDDSYSSKDWSVRLLSGGGSPANNTKFPSQGAITFQLATSTAQPDAKITVWIDDSDGIECLQAIPVNNNGKWNKYILPLYQFAEESITGNGQWNAQEISIDAIHLSQSESSANWVFYIDELRHELNLGSTTQIYSQSFENGIETWTQENNDDINWIVHSGPTSSTETGAPEATDGEYYIYVESSYPNYPDKTANLTSPEFDFSNKLNPAISFDYHMYGAYMGTLNFQVSSNKNNWTTIWSKTANQDNAWHSANIDLSAYENWSQIYFRLNATTGSLYRSDICLDNISITAVTGKSVTEISSTNNLNANNITIYPQPAKEALYVKLPDTREMVNIQLYSINGQLVHSTTHNTGEDIAKINLANVNPGLYIVKIFSNTTSYNQTVVIN